MSAEEREGMVPEMSVMRTAAIERLLMDTIQGEPAARRHRVRSRVLAWGTVGVVAIAAATAGATFIHGPAPVTNSTLVHCLAIADQSALGTNQDVESTAATTRQGAPKVTDYVTTCAQNWVEGVFNSLPASAVAAHSPGKAPVNLTVCIAPDGSAVVVPGRSNVCDAIGFAPWNG